LQPHAYVRARLVERYGASVAPPNGMIPAHLLGNLWAQNWENIYDILAPSGVPPSVDVTGLLVAHRVDERGMIRYGERFYTSLGFDSLPATFWERSLITKPRDRGRPLALGSVCGRHQTGSLQCGVVGPEAPLPGRRRAGGALGAGLRPRGEIPRRGECAVHPLLHRADPAVPVPPLVVPGGGVDGSAVPLLRVRQRGGGAAARPHARR